MLDADVRYLSMALSISLDDGSLGEAAFSENPTLDSSLSNR